MTPPRRPAMMRPLQAASEEDFHHMAAARFVHLEGIETPCLLVCDETMPEELVVDYPEKNGDDIAGRGSVVYRLQPSTAGGAHPTYVEVFDE